MLPRCASGPTKQPSHALLIETRPRAVRKSDRRSRSSFSAHVHRDSRPTTRCGEGDPRR